MIKPKPFCLKPQDALAIRAIEYWIDEAVEFGVSQTKVKRAREHRNAIVNWQTANPSKVKVPD